MPSFLSIAADTRIDLSAQGGLPGAAHIIDADSIMAINAALATGRPLLVRGEPGTGKSQLARAVAQQLGRAFLQHTVDSRTETRDLLWTVDAVARLAEAQLIGALSQSKPESVEGRMEIANFVQPGPLWWAFDWASAKAQATRARITSPRTLGSGTPERGIVLLIDEIDKADPAVPNGLLDALGHGRFDVPGHDAVEMLAGTRPLVVITTNEERSLPDAFIRRCLVLHLTLPSGRAELIHVLTQRGRAHFQPVKCSDQVLAKAAEQLVLDRGKVQQRDLSPPGVAEYIDLLHALTEQTQDEAEQLKLLDRIAKFAFDKHPIVGPR